MNDTETVLKPISEIALAIDAMTIEEFFALLFGLAHQQPGGKFHNHDINPT